MAWKGFTLNGEKTHVPLGSKSPKSCALITEPRSPNCANAGQSGYFLFVSILPSNLLSRWHAFFVVVFGLFFLASRKIRAYPRIFCQLPIQLLFVQGSCEPDRGLDIGTLCPAQSSRPCPDQAPGEVKEEMPSHASQLALC